MGSAVKYISKEVIDQEKEELLLMLEAKRDSTYPTVTIEMAKNQAELVRFLIEIKEKE